MQSRRGWCEIEDDRLLKIIKKYGTKNWSLISDKLSIGTTFERTGKQCRERWYNHLNPDINNEVWTKEEDEMLFDAHRRHGSKWKEISKNFTGRTDNSIKNHFYSTVRKCLRTISKIRGQKNTTITMKSIKPYVLSKIVENSELTDLIVQLGRSKFKGSNDLNIEEQVLQRISAQLQRISLEYQSKNKQNSELTKKRAQPRSSQSLNSLSPRSEHHSERIQPAQEPEKLQFKPEDIPMKQYFEEFQSHHHERSEYVETQHQSKNKQEIQPKDIFLFPGMSLSQQFKEEAAANKCQYLQKELPCEESCIFEECESNFFVSPSCGTKKSFPDLRLIGKISRNSHPSPNYSSRHEQRGQVTISKRVFMLEEEPVVEFHFDPHEYFNSEGQQRVLRDEQKDNIRSGK